VPEDVVGGAADGALAGSFGWIDWTIVVALFALTHWIGRVTAGKPSTIREFFLGGRTLPWYAVTGSIIATEISAVTLISLPATVFRDRGDIAYLQLGLIGLFLARWVVALVLIPKYFEREIYSPYDYMGGALGGNVRKATTALFSIGGVLGQAARVYLTGIVLEIVLHDEFAAFEAATGIRGLWLSIAVIGAVSIVWTWLGGMATVIWTDAVLFVVFLVAVASALVAVVSGVDGGAAEVARLGAEAGKFRFFDTDFSFSKPNTLLAALVASTLVGIGAFGTDQLMAQRVFCCRSVRDAQKAMIASYASMIVAVLVAMVGIALYAYYRHHPLSGQALALYEQKNDRIFPIFIVETLPVGLKGLIVAGVFAAAISSLDSILAALSQTVMSAFVLREDGTPRDERRAMRTSKLLVLGFGVLLCAVAASCELVQRDPRFAQVLDLALAMPGYTQGAVLAAFALAAFRGGAAEGRAYLWSAPLSVMVVVSAAWHETWTLWALSLASLAFAAAWMRWGIRPGWESAEPTLAPSLVLALGIAAAFAFQLVEPKPAWPWFSPLGCATAFGFAKLLVLSGYSSRERKSRNSPACASTVAAGPTRRK
jgi:solute:Na+ symporter, SSS family